MASADPLAVCAPVCDRVTLAATATIGHGWLSDWIVEASA
jgi:hypothetical protein